jgi:hypothetical protein
MSRAGFALAILLFVVPLALAASPPTVVGHYQPLVAGKVAPGLTVTATRSGDCPGASLVSSRIYAWRCFQGNLIRDPCFSQPPKSAIVVCPQAPWNRRVLVLRLTRPLPTGWVGIRQKGNFPWAVITADGRHCTSYAGIAGLGLAATYGCQDGSNLAGYVRRGSATWTIHETRHQPAGLVVVGVSEVWW